MQYKKGVLIKHPKMDWGRGVVLEDSNGTNVKISFEKVGVKTLSLRGFVDLPLKVASAIAAGGIC